jgi:hypothetical protein
MLKWMNLIGTAGALASCTPRPVDTFCTSYIPVNYSAARDTPETVRQVQENNAVWRSLCRS